MPKQGGNKQLPKSYCLCDGCVGNRNFMKKYLNKCSRKYAEKEIKEQLNE